MTRKGWRWVLYFRKGTKLTVRRPPGQGFSASQSKNGESESRFEKLRVGVAAGPQQNAETPRSLWLTTELCLSWKLRLVLYEKRSAVTSLGVETRAGISRLCESASTGSASRLARTTTTSYISHTTNSGQLKTHPHHHLSETLPLADVFCASAYSQST